VGEGGGGAGGVGGFGGFGGFGGAGGSVGQGGILNLCGNGAIDAGEECDDMNITIGDGCDACQVNCKANAVEDPATHHCYFFSTISATWMDAKGDCEEIGYHLATITSQPEMDFLKGIPSTDLWIGASDSSGAWTWVTNEPWVYAPWEPMQPNNNGDCGELGCNAEQDGGTINDVNCAEVQPYLCEWAPPGTP
jgi:cysteine-rich repeat protein